MKDLFKENKVLFFAGNDGSGMTQHAETQDKKEEQGQLTPMAAKVKKCLGDTLFCKIGEGEDASEIAKRSLYAFYDVEVDDKEESTENTVVDTNMNA